MPIKNNVEFISTTFPKMVSQIINKACSSKRKKQDAKFNDQDNKGAQSKKHQPNMNIQKTSNDVVHVKRLNQFKIPRCNGAYCARTNLGGSQLREVTLQ